MTWRPSSIEALAAGITSHARLRMRGGGSKPALSSPAAGETSLDMSGLAGIVEYTPEECTFTALAGTPIRDIERALAPHGQHLPFDPPLSSAGATIGGAVAAGTSGSCRYRFGGIRDFVIGARLVDGRGQLVTTGGKVVKNAAGFLLHQALVGSCGAFGAIVELTFKVFPAAEAHATLRIETGDVAAAMATVQAIERARFDLEALDVEPPGTVWLRLGGFGEALPARVDAISQALASMPTIAGGSVTSITGDHEADAWLGASAFSWVPSGAALVRVPTTVRAIGALDAALGQQGASRRYAVAGNLAWIGWPGPVAALDEMLRAHALRGQVLVGDVDRPFIGLPHDNAFGARVKAVFDPDGRF